MTRTTHRLTNEGLIKIDKARQLKGWNKTSKKWIDESMSSESTLKRFLRGDAISAENFIKLCQAVGIEDWHNLVDWEKDIDSTKVHVHQNLSSNEISETAKPRYSLTITGIFTEDQQLQIRGILIALKKLLSNSQIIIQGKDNGNELDD